MGRPSKSFTLRTLATLFILQGVRAAYGVTVWDESVNGNLSTDQVNPTPIALSTGTNSVLGTVGGTRTQAFVQITVPTGDVLSAYTNAAYSSTDAQGFTGFQSGAAFVGSAFTAGSYEGYTHYGTGAANGSLPPANLIGTNLLPLMADPTLAAGATGFTPPLSAGTYTFLIQQLGANTTYQFDFGVTPAPAPEPASLALLAIPALLLLKKKRH